MNFWVLFDHIVVGGARFGLSIVVARLLGVNEFGTYSLIWTIWAFASSLHVPALVNPMMQLIPRVPRHRLPDLLWVTIYNQLIYSLILIPLITVAVIVFFGWNEISIAMCIAVNSYVFVFNTYELLRRYFFVTKKEKLAVFLDTLVYLFIGLFVYILVHYEKFSIVSYFFMSSVPIIVLLIFMNRFLPVRQRVSLIHKAYIRRTYNIAKPLFFSTLCVFLSGHMFVYMTALFIGTSEVGGISAIRNLTGPFLLLLLALDNSVTRQSIILAKQSNQLLLDYLTSLRAFWVLAFSVACAVLALFAEEIILITFGQDFLEFYELLYWMCVSLIFMLLSRLQAVRLRAEEKFNVIKKSNFMSMIVVVICTPFFIYFFEMTGVGMCVVLIAFSVLFFQNWYDKRVLFLWS